MKFVYLGGFIINYLII